MKDTPRLFLDASVFVAAAGSPRGGSALILETSRQGLTRAVSSRLVLLEAERNIAKKLGDRPLLGFYETLGLLELEIVPDPTPEEIEVLAGIIDAKDTHVLAAALKGEVEFLLTLDRRHFMTRKVLETGLSFEILTPGEFLRRLVAGLGSR